MLNESLAIQLNKILDEYADKLDDTIEKEITDVAKETAKDLKSSSPKRTGAYARDWAVKKTKSKYGKIVYNRKHYQLTHLLNNGHVVRNKYGTYGRVNGDNHIGEAEQRAIEKLVNNLERKL